MKGLRSRSRVHVAVMKGILLRTCNVDELLLLFTLDNHLKIIVVHIMQR